MVPRVIPWTTSSSNPLIPRNLPPAGAARLLLTAACLALSACDRDPPARPDQVTFAEVAEVSGVRFTHQNGATGNRFLAETTVGGAAWIDFDADGFQDIYLVSGNEHPDVGGKGSTGNRLYRNLGGGAFSDVTAATGAACGLYGSGVAVGDLDNDGFPDLYVTNLGDNVLFHNEQGRRFEDVTARARVPGGKWSTSAAFLDQDLDGDLDLYVCRYVDYDPAKKCKTGGTPTYCSPHEFPGLPDVLYKNRGDGTFDDISKAAGIAVAGPESGKSLGVVVLDHDEDGDQDVYVACDQVPNLLFRNDRNDHFTEVGLLANVAFSADGASQAGMGVDAGDVDLDGREDIVVTNFSDEPNALYHNDGGGFFTEASRRFDLAGLTLERLGFGILLSDLDRDGDLDLYIANGHVQDNIGVLRPGRSFAQQDQFLESEGGRKFSDVSARSGAWFQLATVSRSAASADYDEDGDEDLLVLSTAGPVALLRNDGPPAHWIAFRLVGTTSNRDGYGTRVTVHVRRGAETWRRVGVCRAARSYASSCDPRVRFGLGRLPVKVERVDLEWPSGKRQTLAEPVLDRVHEVKEP